MKKMQTTKMQEQGRETLEKSSIYGTGKKSEEKNPALVDSLRLWKIREKSSVRKKKPEKEANSTEDVKTYLQQYISANIAINGGLDELIRLRALAERVTASMNGQPKGSQGSREEVLCKMVDLEGEIDQRIQKMVALRKKIEQEISQLQDQRYRSLLQLRYFNGWTLEKISGEMGYSSRQAVRIYNQALKQFQKEILEKMS